MTRTNDRNQLRTDLDAFANGSDRTPGIIRRLQRLVEVVDEVPWREELTFVLGSYQAPSDTTGETPLAALAELVLENWATKKPEPRWRLRVPPDAKGLAKRWQDETGRKRARDVVRAFVAGGDLGKVAFGEHAGRLDLRGFVDPDDASHYRQVVDFDSLDLSGARLGHLTFMNRTIRNCRFDGTSFGNLSLFSTRIVDSSFRGADLGEMALLDGNGESWMARLRGRARLGGRARLAQPHLRVDFAGANLNGLWAKRRGFEECDFSNAKLNRAQFDCDVLRCRFAGHLHETSFNARGFMAWRSARFEAVDLRNAELHWVAFRGVDLDGFRLPDDPRIRVVNNWSCVRRQILDRYPGAADRPVAIRIAMIADNYLAANDTAVLELSTIEEEAGPEGTAELVRLLDSAEANCSPASS